MSTTLAKELDVYNRLLPSLLADPAKVGKYVLIHGDVFAGVFSTQDEAIEAGYDRFGVVPLLAKKISEKEPLLFFPRMINRCPS